jgi:hypothetical protein
MSYADGEASILDLLHQVTGFRTANTSQGDWGVLNSGKDRVYAILKPGDFDRSRPAPAAVEARWSTTIQVWVHYKDDGESLAVLETSVQAILDTFDRYPHLGNVNVIQSGFAKSGSDVQEMWKRGGAQPVWLRQDITVPWSEYTVITRAE